MIGNGITATSMDVVNVNGGNTKLEQHHRLLVGSRSTTGMTSPTLPKMNGVRHHGNNNINSNHSHNPVINHQQSYNGHHSFNINSQMNSSKVSNHQGPQSPLPMQRIQTSPTLLVKPQSLDLSVRDLYLHDSSSQELSRSALSNIGPRLIRTPNPNLTPTQHTNPGSSVATTSNATATYPPFNPSNMNRTLTSSEPSPPLPSSSSSSAMAAVVMSQNVIPGTTKCAQVDPPDVTIGSVQEVLGSLALLSVISAIVAFLAVLFLTRIMAAAALAPHSIPCNSSDGGGCILHIDAAEYKLVYEVIIGLTACTISLDFTCLLICCAQFMFTSKLMKSPTASERAGQYLRQSSFTRIIAVGGFFISIPVLLTGIILHAFIQFEAKPAIITSVLLGVSIIFCGLAMIHNVYVWQREKTKISVVRSSPAVICIGNDRGELKVQDVVVTDQTLGSNTMDTTQQNANMELSTLV